MSAPTILAIDTATENCSVALHYQGQTYYQGQVAPQQHAALILSMVDQLLAEAKVEREQIEVIGYGAGPGSFTGVRIAVATAQALALGWDCQVFGVSDLKLLAYPLFKQAPEHHYILACSDARMGEVYFALYQKVEQHLKTIIAEQVAAPEHALSQIKEALQASATATASTAATATAATTATAAAPAVSTLTMSGAGTGIAILQQHDQEQVLSQINLTNATQDASAPTNLLYPQADAIIAYALNEGMTLQDPSEAEPLYCRNEVTWKKVSEQPSPLAHK